MKASIIASTIALFGSALALPTTTPSGSQPSLRITLTNDISGTSVGRLVNADRVTNKFSDLFVGTALARDGRIIATSIQNTNPGQSRVSCTIVDPSGRIIPAGSPAVINPQTTFVNLSSDKSKAVATDVSNLTITCRT